MFKLLSLVAVGSLALAAVGQAQTYYSVDVANDVLCAVDVYTGVATPLGPLGVDVASVDLAWHQNALYAKTFGSPAGNKLCQIVTDGHWLGFALQGQFLVGGGYQGAEAGGIASDENSLFVTYSVEAPGGFTSNRFGRVDTIWSGLITQVAAMPYDIDAMGFAGGEFWGIDVITPGSGYKLYHGSSASGPMTPVASPGGDTYDVATNPVDTAYFSPTELVAISQNGHNLVRVNKLNGTRGIVTPIVGLQPGGMLNGLALRPKPCKLSIHQ